MENEEVYETEAQPIDPAPPAIEEELAFIEPEIDE